ACDADGVEVGGERIAARTILWAAGVAASPIAKWLDAPADRAGRVMVREDLSVPGHPEIFAIGDTCASLSWDGKLAPGVAPAAKQMGGYAARDPGAHRRGFRATTIPLPPSRQSRDDRAKQCGGGFRLDDALWPACLAGVERRAYF